MANESPSYDLGRVEREAGTVDPAVLWQRAVEQAERFQRSADQQRLIIDQQKVRMMNTNDQLSALRRQLRAAGIEPCV